jgi:hypothetical protein
MTTPLRPVDYAGHVPDPGTAITIAELCAKADAILTEIRILAGRVIDQNSWCYVCGPVNPNPDGTACTHPGKVRPA